MKKFKTTPKQKAKIAAWATFGFLYGFIIMPMQTNHPDLAGALGGASGCTLTFGFLALSYYYFKWKKSQK
ncbi:MAG: hypothetical protein R6U32_03210 [Candidatus Woesearchaeota archaeon]